MDSSARRGRSARVVDGGGSKELLDLNDVALGVFQQEHTEAQLLVVPGLGECLDAQPLHVFVPLVNVVDHDGYHDGLCGAGSVVSRVAVDKAHVGFLGYLEYLGPSLVDDQLEAHDVSVELLGFLEVIVVKECDQSVDCWGSQVLHLPYPLSEGS